LNSTIAAVRPLSDIPEIRQVGEAFRKSKDGEIVTLLIAVKGNENL
jgi:hypothetical protein